METRKINIKDIVLNEGQIPGLPTNPRQWTKDEMENLKKSLQETPELFEARGVIVTPHEGKYIVLGGNMRLSASKALTQGSAVHHRSGGNTRGQAQGDVIKDNGSFGSWDFDLLANEWDDLPLTDWGVPAWNTNTEGEDVSPDNFGESFKLPDGEKSPFQQMTFTLADTQVEEIKEAIEEAKHLEEYKSMITYGNENGNGNAIALIIEQWIESRR